MDLLILDEVGFIPFFRERRRGPVRDSGGEVRARFRPSRQQPGLRQLDGRPRGRPPARTLLDRLTRRCYIIKFRGDCYRFKEESAQKGEDEDRDLGVVPFLVIRAALFWVDKPTDLPRTGVGCRLAEGKQRRRPCPYPWPEGPARSAAILRTMAGRAFAS